MKLCFLVTEFFGWGKFGGYGSSTRILATELVRRGCAVTVLTPQRKDQPREDIVDGVRMVAYPAMRLRELARHCAAAAADVYHSHEPSMATVMARRAVPAARHIVTCRDTRLMRDWLIEMGAWIRDGSFQTLLSFPYENNPLVRRAVQAADAVYCPNEFSRELAQRKYRLAEQPAFLPSPLRLPDRVWPKSEQPTAVYLGRLDSRKRPELFLRLADEFPNVKFVVIGKGRTEAFERRLRERHADKQNVEFVGFIDQFESERLYEQLHGAWVLINTARREGLPRSFMEAAACGCAILSRVDPDGFATRFGYRAARDEFADGLRALLANDAWRARGAAAREYVTSVYGLDRAVEAHLGAYRDALESEPRAA